MKDMRMFFGFALLALIAALAFAIALGKVEQQTSYGLDLIIGSLTTLAGGFAHWAFSDKEKL